MKAKCIKELTIDGYRFDPGKEYNFEWRAFTREADDDDPCWLAAARVRYIQYAVKYDMLVPLPFNKRGLEKVPAMLYFYDRQYCEHEDYTAPAIDPFGWTAGSPLFCFDDFFEDLLIPEDAVEQLKEWWPKDQPLRKDFGIIPPDKLFGEDFQRLIRGNSVNNF